MSKMTRNFAMVLGLLAMLGAGGCSSSSGPQVDNSGTGGSGGGGSGGSSSSSSGSSSSGTTSSGAIVPCTTQNVDGLWGTESVKGVAALKLDSASTSFTLDTYVPQSGAIVHSEVVGTYDVTSSVLVLDRGGSTCGSAQIFDYECVTSDDFMWLATPGDPAVQWQRNAPFLPVQGQVVPGCGL